MIWLNPSHFRCCPQGHDLTWPSPVPSFQPFFHGLKAFLKMRSTSQLGVKTLDQFHQMFYTRSQSPHTLDRHFSCGAETREFTMGWSGMRVLLVEDDSKVAEFIKLGLREAGFAVDHVDNGVDGFSYGQNTFYAVLIVDIMLPGMDGLSLVGKLRDHGVKTPILVLSARQSVDDRVAGLRKGSDDYLTKPFAFTELLARIQALVRRSSGLNQETTKLTVGDLNLNLLTREAERQGTIIPLQNKEFELLEYLMRNHDRVISKTMIIEHVWNYDFDPQTNVVEVRVSRLRDKIDKGFDKKLIHTIRGAGYIIRQN